MCIRTIFAFLFLSSVLQQLPVLAQDKNAIDSTTTPFYQPHIDELSNLKRRTQNEATVSVAGFQTTTLRESPGIVTLITQEEIANSGAKDLIDILRTVQGFDIAFDIAPVLTMRGNNGSEAKILFSIDGIVMNNIAFGGLYPIMRYPVHSIERIEIIRGAGSAQYGGMAGLAVINIITKKAKNNFEGGANATVGVADGGLLRNNFDAWASTKLANGVRIDLSAMQITGKFSNKIEEANGLYTNRVNLRDNDQTSNSYWNFGLQYKKLSLRYINSNTNTNLLWLGNSQLTTNNNFFSAGYRVDISNKLVLHNAASWLRQTPNNYSNIPTQTLTDTAKLNILRLFNTVDERYATKNYLVYEWNEKLSTTAGVEFLYDYAVYTNNVRFRDRSRTTDFFGAAGFAEINFSSKYANITAGARYEKYGNITPVAVPRIAITKAFEKVHFKALYTQAFKNPTIFNIEYAENGSGNIEPERFVLIELEAGWRPLPNLQLAANVYDIRISNYVTRKDVLDASGNASASYANLGNTGTQGIEGEVKWQPKWGSISANYSFYRVVEMSSFLKLPRVSQVFPGIPSQKFTFQGFVKILPNWTASTTVQYFNNKFRINALNQNLNEPIEFPAELHVNLYTQLNNIIFKNFSIGLGCFNLLDGNYRLLPWKVDASSFIDLPWQGREFYAKFIYNFKN